MLTLAAECICVGFEAGITTAPVASPRISRGVRTGRVLPPRFCLGLVALLMRNSAATPGAEKFLDSVVAERMTGNADQSKPHRSALVQTASDLS